MADNINRLFRIYNRLRRGPVTIEIISAWAEAAGITVSRRQLYRDLNSLQRLRIADGENVVEHNDEKNRKTWKLEYNGTFEKLSTYDINSFFLLKSFSPYAVLEKRRSSIEKFEKIIYKNFSKNNFEKYIQANELFLRKTNYNDNLYGVEEQKIIEDLIWTLHNKRVIIIEQDLINAANIHVSKNSFPLLMYPIELVFHRGRIYLSGFSKTNQLLIFAIDKQFRYTLTNETFNRKKLLSVYKGKFEKLFGISPSANNKVYHIKLELTQGYAQSTKSFYWHHTQQWEELKKGNYLLHLHCSIGRELVGFIVGGLGRVKVHQPKILRDLVLKKLKETVVIYEKNLGLDEERTNEGC